jgi:hypothetical protein
VEEGEVRAGKAVEGTAGQTAAGIRKENAKNA